MPCWCVPLIEIVMRSMFVVLLWASILSYSLIVYGYFFDSFFFRGINFVRQIGLVFYAIKSFLLYIPVIIRYFMNHSSSPRSIAFNIYHLFYTNHSIAFSTLDPLNQSVQFTHLPRICYTKYALSNILIEARPNSCSTDIIFISKIY